MDISLRNIPRRAIVLVAVAGAVAVAIQLILCWRWSREPPLYPEPQALVEAPPVAGYATVSTLAEVVDWLLEKPGGYLSNDIYPASLWLDDMPNFEFGVLVQARDLSRALRNNYSRSPNQPTEHEGLAIAEPALNYRNDRWVFPSTQRRLGEARNALIRFRSELVSLERDDARFFAGADNLGDWLAVVERRLGALVQRLANGDTAWLEIDDVFYEARGTAWALLQFMAAAQIDFDGVLRDKNAAAGLQQIMRELEGALGGVRSPIILNGAGFGFFANHSLVLASYLSRANAGVADLRTLLAEG